MSAEPVKAQPTEPNRFCLQCRYPLVEGTAERCPECGRAFDPLDEKTFAQSPSDDGADRLFLIHATLSAYPLVMVGMIYLAWLITWWQLGHRPVPFRDDPRSVGGAATAIYRLSFLCCAGSLPFIVFHFVIVAFVALSVHLNKGLAKQNIPWLMLLPVASWSAAFFLLLWDPLGVGNWFMD